MQKYARCACDVIRRAILDGIMDFVSPNKVVRLTKATIKDSTYHVKIGPVMNEGFRVGNGLKQGDGHALGLFIVALECVTNNTVT
jgi:hypothetical protein